MFVRLKVCLLLLLVLHLPSLQRKTVEMRLVAAEKAAKQRAEKAAAKKAATDQQQQAAAAAAAAARDDAFAKAMNQVRAKFTSSSSAEHSPPLVGEM
jgi:hypothetical protein